MKTIAVICDSTFLRELITLALQQNGYEVLAAAGSVDALPLLAQRKPDLALVDLRLPDLAGVKILRSIRNSPPLRAMPVFILSEHEQRACVVQISQLGIQAYLLTPQLDVPRLLHRIAQQIGPATSKPAVAAAIGEVWGTIEGIADLADK